MSVAPILLYIRFFAFSPMVFRSKWIVDEQVHVVIKFLLVIDPECRTNF